MPFFSIIIPVYNVAPYLRECLDSVLAQTFSDWEAICVDDGSTDGSGAILDEYVARDKRFRVIHQKNAGVSAARNLALDRSNGEYVCFLDADDLVLKDWLSNIYSVASKCTSVDWVRTWHQYLLDSGKLVVSDDKHFAYEKIWCSNDKNAIATDAWWRFSRKGMLCINVYKRSCVANIRFNVRLSKREDTCFCAAVLKNVSSFICIGDISYLYRQHASSASHKSQPFKELFCASKIMSELWYETCLDRCAITANFVQNYRLVVNSNAEISEIEWAEFRDFLVTSWKRRVFTLRYFGLKERLRWFVFLLSGFNGALTLNVRSVLERIRCIGNGR